ncbi:MAG TPA: TIGR01212 family radical SAM protein [Clostridia bacterium]|nr:TIGR01212 family radical SAM protein [Clostridia bacterium]
MTNTWGGKRYNTLNHFLRERFGEKVFKIPLDAGFTCPNRDGSIASGGCVFCSPRGSGDFTGTACDLAEQFQEVKAMMNKKWKSGRYIGYFQAYTNTYAPVDVLRKKYYSILEQEDVVGIAVATRPDCLPADVLELLSEINGRAYLWVELGLQTIHEHTARLINRGYGLEAYINSVKELKKRGIEVVTHEILGLPGEDSKEMLQTLDFIANTGTQGIKLHLLHLMKDTRLEEMYKRGEFRLMSMEDYVETVADCIERLPGNMAIHRITGDGPRDTLIGPKWSLKKFEVINAIEHLLMDRDTWQGKKYVEDKDIGDMFRI